MDDIYYYGQIFGYITAVINFCLYLPQVLHVYHIQNTTSLNSYFLILQIASCLTTLSYGYIIHEYPIIISSISILISCGFLGYAKWKLFVSDDTSLSNYCNNDNNNNNIINNNKFIPQYTYHRVP